MSKKDVYDEWLRLRDKEELTNEELLRFEFLDDYVQRYINLD